MSTPLMLSFDVGSQSIRVMLVNMQGEIIDMQQSKFEKAYISIKENYAEQKPNFYFEHCIKAVSKLMSRNIESNIVGMALGCIRDTTVCLDKQYKPIRNSIVWVDKREVKQNPKIPVFKKIIFSMVKMKAIIYRQYKQSVCNWIAINEPEIWEKTDKYVMLPTYLNYCFTGILKDSVANMIGHIPFNAKKRKWMDKNSITRFIFDVPKEKLCELCEPGDIIGYVTKEISELSGIPEGIPLIATGADKGLEAIGLSVISPNQAALSFGTASVIQVTTKNYVEPAPFVPAYVAPVKGYYNSEIQTYRGYWMVSWFKQEFAPLEVEQAKQQGIKVEKLLDSYLQEVPAGCEGLMLQPYWVSGVTTPTAKGAIIGFNEVHTKKHIYRAIIEGIAFSLLDGMYQLQKRTGNKITEIFVGGGGSHSDIACQITANIFGVPLKRTQSPEITGVGGAIIGFIGLKYFENEQDAIKSMVHTGTVFMPDEKEHEYYFQLYHGVYKHLFKKLNPLYQNISNIRDKVGR